MNGPETEVHLSWGAASHRGARRQLNEDRFLVSRSVFLVADGMGGHDAGEVASATAIAALRPLADLDVVRPEDVRARLVAAQDDVRAIVTEPGRGAGTTLSGVAVSEQDGNPYWLVLNVGDSRTYHLSGGRLDQVSVDHSEVQEMVDAGLLTAGEALTHPRRHVVTRALGSRNEPQPDFWYVPIESHDRVLVCSDGLTGELSDERIAEILLEHPDPQSAAERLVHEAIVAGGRDNITVVVVDATGVQDDTGAGSTAPRDRLPATDSTIDDDTLPREVRLQMGGLT
ncbi:PP2C family protein-serine/threonine phosphatase [Cellulosimicrobium marinum]|uniref:PP2C family protein-serine/threonine phosphatase n=1 Tax=Cellulosimicrobium marinum TaxID=1638992 RepID=UPI001E3C87B2|nr:protein phosphatase 2C domain-containing protein [Cellulosimicrobium marinum]MCB7136833.1 protein phosphatase 2C domain-containing protein [Cellulosimicrobium marinum]